MDIISLVFPGLATLAGHLTPISPSNIAVSQQYILVHITTSTVKTPRMIWLLLFVY